MIRKVGENETTYKFHRAIKVDGGASVTVWSSDCGQTHEPPSNLVMKSQRFFVGENMTTHLMNTDGEVSIAFNFFLLYNNAHKSFQKFKRRQQRENQGRFQFLLTFKW